MTRLRLVLIVACAGALAAALVTASRLSASDGSDAGTPGMASPRAYAGIPQAGSVLGRPDAPVTLVEYADLQCPYCAEWAARTLPTLVEKYVRAGELRIVFRGLAFIGPDSHRALGAVVAAGPSGRSWDVVDALYRRQGGENSGWVTDDLLGEVAVEVGLAPSLLRAAAGSRVAAELARNDRAAHAAGVTGTPAFQLGRTGGLLTLVELRSLDPEGLVPSIDALLSR